MKINKSLNEQIDRIKSMMVIITEKVFDTDYYDSSITSRPNPKYNYDDRDVEPEYFDEYDDEEEDIFDVVDDDEEEDDYDAEMSMFRDLNYGAKNDEPDLRTDYEKELENRVGKNVEKNKYLNMGKNFNDIEIEPEDNNKSEKNNLRKKYNLKLLDFFVSSERATIYRYIINGNEKLIKKIKPESLEVIKKFVPFFDKEKNTDNNPIDSIKRLDIENEYQLELLYFILLNQKYREPMLHPNQRHILKLFKLATNISTGQTGFRKSTHPTFEQFKMVLKAHRLI